jgi:hypothetical protein
MAQAILYLATRGQTFTYRLDGPCYVHGRGDLHDTKYNYMGVRTDLATIQSSSS